MKVKNYTIKTVAGAQVYTSGRSLSKTQTESHHRPFTSTDPSERMIAYWSKKIGEPVRAEECGTAEVMYV